MKKFLFDNKINFLLFLISFLSLVFVLGIENISLNSTKWLHNESDTATHQLGWHFFKNDIWRFPLGSNPNYGDELGSSIVFSASIPILALFFKLFKELLPDSFQYFSIWYFICFYLQLFFSYKILKKFTKSEIYSLVGSIFFLIAPILIFRLYIGHSVLAGQWILLCALFLGLTKEIEESKWLWFSLIILSSLIIYQFLIIILTTYSLLRIFNLKFNKVKIIEFVKDFSIIGLLLLLILYIVGYFQIRAVDTLAVGFGDYKLNLLNIFDPTSTDDKISFSWFLPDIRLTTGEEGEGFNYFGLGQITMILFALVLLFSKKYKSNLSLIRNSKIIKAFVLISIFFTFWALSNKISFGSHTILEIPLNKYIFGLLSVAKNTGRLFWIVNYFLLTLSIIIIYECYKGKKSLLIITIFLIIQVVDISSGLKKFMTDSVFEIHKNPSYFLSDSIWNNLFQNYKIIKTTYPVAYSEFFSKLSYAMEKNNTKKTNIVKLARFNRKAAAEAKYNLYNDFRKKDLASDTVYLIHGLGHLRHLNHIFKNENVGFFYRDNLWVMVANEKEKMNNKDRQMFNELEFKLLKINQKNNLSINNIDNYYGFGWSHNTGKTGIWSEGPKSTLLFRINKNYGDLKLDILCEPYITRKNKNLKLDIYVNNSLNKKIVLTKNQQNKKIEVLIEKEFIKDNNIKIDFSFKNPISPYEVLESPDSRKLGILVKSIYLYPLN